MSIFVDRNYNKSLQVPIKYRQNVISALYAIDNFTNDYKQGVQYLFAVWNKYLNGNDAPQDISCPACRSNIVTYFRNFKNEWRKRGHIDENGKYIIES